MTPWHDAVDSLGDWLESEAEKHLAFRRRVYRILAGLVAGVVVEGVTLAVALFILGQQVGANRTLVTATCASQRHTLDERRESLTTSVPLFRKLIPPDKLAAAVARTRVHIAQLERDRRKLHCPH